jgi:hypothetical protein
VQGNDGGTLAGAGDERGRGWGSGAREENARAFETGPVAHLSTRWERWSDEGTTKILTYWMLGRIRNIFVLFK